jgi:hypothetical protein
MPSRYARAVDLAGPGKSDAYKAVASQPARTVELSRAPSVGARTHARNGGVRPNAQSDAMAREEEEEREFLAELKARSGRDLGEWMAAITAQGFADKNHVIDWLRAQGFPFARASWLERIHNNGGRPIYLAPAGSAAPCAPGPSVARAGEPPRPSAQLESLLAAAKGYRPLYQLLEASILKALPGTQITAKAGYIGMQHRREFAAVALNARELRLGLALGDRPFTSGLQKATLKGVGAAITHMLVLTDARQVNEELMQLVVEASDRAKR